MALRNFLQKILVSRRNLGRRLSAEQLGLHSVEQFLYLLRRERIRTDRSGTSFSLLALSISGQEPYQASLLRLADILRRRLRCTDDAGLLADRRVGVLLPDTPPEGAERVASDLRSLFEIGNRKLVCEIYVYPSDQDQMPGGSGQESQAPPLDQPVLPLEAILCESLPAWKRALDVVGAIVGLVLLAPLMLLVAALIKLTSPGPMLFVQERSGRGGRPFAMYKFRTMVVNADEIKCRLQKLNERDGPAFKMRHDPRVTPLGRWLRTSSVDELPQLWNVLRGDMSLVGPRPLPRRESDACLRWHKRRLDVTPGLTCIWQVDRQPSTAFHEWVRMDLRYIQSRSIGHDLKLLLRTVAVVVTGKGGR